jgi:hypothetical protein
MLKFGWIRRNVPGMCGSISDLQAGQKVQITKGGGFLPVQWTSTKVVFEVSGHSAICTDGTCISCMDSGSVRPLSVFVENPQLTTHGSKIYDKMMNQQPVQYEEELDW